MQHVIIGAGPAGVIAAESLRAHDADATITIVGEESEPPYSRMALPYLLVKQIQESGTYLRKSAQHYERNDIAIIEDRVESIDSAARLVSLSGGKQLSYDQLLVASGSRPVAPPIPGVDLPGVFPCWTLADARNIIGRCKDGARVVLMGAGFIGCIILEALVKTGAQLTVIEMGDRMVPRMMNEKAGGLIKRWCESKGLVVHTTTRVTGIENKGDTLSVSLNNGEVLAADLVISATGVRPNVEFLDGAGIDIDHGILVDWHMRSNRKDIYAAGDVAQGRDFSTGEYTVQAIQPTAAEHARIAAANMAGGELEHRGSVNMNVLDTLGLVSSSFGLWMGTQGGDSAELYNPEQFRYINLQFRDDVLVGATSLGLTQHVGVLRGLIQTEIRLGKWKQRLMDDPTRIMEAYLGSTQAIGFNSGVFAASAAGAHG
jgi:NAD(P)H-nitrite reductase large subunit